MRLSPSKTESRLRRKRSAPPFYKNTCVLARAVIVAMGLLIVMGLVVAG